MQERVDPHKWHYFEERQHGSRKACRWCGARYEAEIHYHHPKPKTDKRRV